MKMLAYRDRPAAEWTPLFWSILRSRIVDVQRRRMFRLRWLCRRRDTHDDSPSTGPTTARTRRARHDGREAYAKLPTRCARCRAANARPSPCAYWKNWTSPTTARAMGCSEGSVKTHLSRAREALQRQLEDWR